MSSPSNTTDPTIEDLADNFDLMLLSQEERIQHALEAIRRKSKAGTSYSVRQASKDYAVPRTTLQDRKNGVPTRNEAHAHRQNLSPAQENILVAWIQAQVGCSSFPACVYSLLVLFYRLSEAFHSRMMRLLTMQPILLRRKSAKVGFRISRGGTPTFRFAGPLVLKNVGQSH